MNTYTLGRTHTHSDYTVFTRTHMLARTQPNQAHLHLHNKTTHKHTLARTLARTQPNHARTLTRSQAHNQTTHTPVPARTHIPKPRTHKHARKHTTKLPTLRNPQTHTRTLACINTHIHTQIQTPRGIPICHVTYIVHTHRLIVLHKPTFS